MTTAINAYRELALTVDIKTSSGDLVNIDMSRIMQASAFENEQESRYSFRSEERFNIRYEGNGLDEQDRAEIASIMEKAEAYLDEYLQNKATPLNQTARKMITSLEAAALPEKKDQLKSSLVDLFDSKIADTKPEDTQLKRMRQLLDELFFNLEQHKKALYA